MNAKLNEKLDRTYMLDILRRLLETPSPSGFCMGIMEMVQAEAKRLGYDMELTPKGNGLLSVEGEAQGETLLLTAHVDTLGAMVRSVKSSGMLRITPIGGYAMQTVEGEYCQVHTRDGKVYEGTVLSTHGARPRLS